jgi:hypothetical protein
MTDDHVGGSERTAQRTERLRMTTCRPESLELESAALARAQSDGVNVCTPRRERALEVGREDLRAATVVVSHDLKNTEGHVIDLGLAQWVGQRYPGA